MATHWNYPDTLPLKDFTSLIEESAIELQKAYSFLIRVTEQPLLLYKEAHIYLKSNRNIVTAVMETSYLKDDKVNSHAFQVFLASVLEEALKTWAKEHKISHNVRVLVRNPNTFPSIFAVYVNDQEVVQFNIFKTWYGVREQILSKKELEENAEKGIVDLQTHIEEIEEKIVNWKKVKDKPTSLLRNPRDVYTLLFKRKHIIANIEKQLQSLEKQKKHFVAEIEQIKEHVPIQIEMYQTKKDYIDLITPFFKELSYSLEKETYNLY